MRCSWPSPTRWSRSRLQPHNVVAGHALLDADDAGSPGFDALEWVPVLDSQLHVEHDAARCQASNRVEVSLDYLWGLPEQQSEAQDQLAQRLSIEHSAAAEPVQLGGDAVGGVDQLVGFCVRFGGQAKRSP